jgi:arginine N-succinyltransferase
MAENAHRFSDRVGAESPGICDDQGHSPFWDAIGRRFFHMSYPAAERLAGGRSKSFIAELMPQYPIYVPLLPEAAQLAIGQLHPVGEVPFTVLAAEGFDTDTYIDIFDGGPTVEARLAALRTVSTSQRLTVARGAAPQGALQASALLANTGTESFCATIGGACCVGNQVWIGEGAMRALDVMPGDDVRLAPLMGEEAYA